MSRNLIFFPQNFALVKNSFQRVNAAIDESTANGQRPSNVKVIVDSMMFGLGKHLRRSLLHFFSSLSLFLCFLLLFFSSLLSKTR